MTGAKIGIIPARGGSKRIPGKNLRPLLGKPIIAYTIEAALESALFDRIIVSTDSAEIAEVARTFGAETPFLRDQTLSDDFTPVSAVTIDTLQRLDPDGSTFRHVAQMLPNCPLKLANDIKGSYLQFLQTAAESQVSVMRYGWQNPWWAMRRDAHGTMRPLFEQAVRARSQDLESLFCPTGVIWWASVDVLRRAGTYYTPNVAGWEIPWQRGLDIDTEDDWAMAELLLRLGMSEEPNVPAVQR
jgi:N-acylneuraminate cytidylyltransferase